MPYVDQESGVVLDPIMNHIMQKVGSDRRALVECINSEPYNFERQDKLSSDMRASLIALRRLGGEDAPDASARAAGAAPEEQRVPAVPRDPERRVLARPPSREPGSAPVVNLGEIESALTNGALKGQQG